MTVVAAASLFDGVMLMADCRVTLRSKGRPDWHCDIAQKIIPLTSHVALAFAGDVRAAAGLIATMHKHAKWRSRFDAESLLQWLPRFFRHTYGLMQSSMAKTPFGHVQLVFAAVNPHRENYVERERVLDLFKRAASPDAAMQRNWMPGIVMEVLRFPPEATFVGIGGTGRVRLAVMQSPEFEPELQPSLTCIAIGSGSGAAVELERTADWIFTSGADLMAQMGMQSAVHDFAVQNDVASIGGMYPCVKITRAGLHALGSSFGDFGSHDVAIVPDAKTGRWIQQNRVTGKRQELLPPWEVLSSLPKSDTRFDDYREAIESLNPRRGKRAPE